MVSRPRIYSEATPELVRAGAFSQVEKNTWKKLSSMSADEILEVPH